MNQSRQAFLEFAKDIAMEAGRLTLEFYSRDLEVRKKKDSSPVTEADIAAEKRMRSRISEYFPRHGIIGEELGSKSAASGDGPTYEWVLDPIDGTKSFIHKVPLYTNLVALLEDGVPIVGVINNPVLEELTSALVGHGAWMNGKRIQVSDTATLDSAWLQLTDPSDLLRRTGAAGAELLRRVGYSRTWADAHGYAMVARGQADLMVDPVMGLWDVACIKPIIEEAGGRFSDLNGRPELGTSCIASNGRLHDEILALFAEKQ